MTEIIETELDPQIKKDQEEWAAGAYDRLVNEIKQLRHAAYIAPGGSDSLFMKWQRGEDGVTKEDWLARIEEINAQYPYPDSDVV